MSDSAGGAQDDNCQLDIDTKFFPTMDEGDSVLLVDDSNEDFGTVRIAFELAIELLMCYVFWSPISARGQRQRKL